MKRVCIRRACQDVLTTTTTKGERVPRSLMNRVLWLELTAYLKVFGDEQLQIDVYNSCLSLLVSSYNFSGP